MKRDLLKILTGAVVTCLAWTGISNGAVNVYHEDFTTSQYKDTFNTTAWWDTVSGELKLYPFAPTLAGSYDTPGNARGVFIAGDHAFVADHASGLQVFDISNPASPTLLGSYDTAGFARGVFVAGDHAFVADDASGLQVIDISDPASPTLAGSYDTPGIASDVFVDGDHAFVADGLSGLRVIDIRFPTSPTLAGAYNTPGTSYKVFVSGNHAFVADGVSGLQVIDISDPAAPTSAGSYNTPGVAFDSFVAGDRAFMADGASGLQVIDITDPTAPTLAGTYDTPISATGVFVSGDRAYVGDGGSGLQVIDITDPSTPTLASSYDTPGTASDVFVAGEYAFVSDGPPGLQVVDIANPVTPAVAGGFTAVSLAYGVCISGDHAYLAYHGGGLQVFDISDPTAPTNVGSYDGPGTEFDVAVAGDYAYLTVRETGLQVIDISDPTAPTRVGRFGTVGEAYGICVAGDRAYVAIWAAGMQVFDISNPTNPLPVGSYDLTGGIAYDVAVAGDHAFLADGGTHGLVVLDITNPTAPALASVYQTPGIAVGVHLSGDLAFVADADSGLAVIDISDPTAPSLVSTYDTPGITWRVFVSGDLAFIADGDSGYQVVDVSDPAVPTQVYIDKTFGYVAGVQISGDHAFVGSAGLKIIQLFESEVDSTTGAGQSLALDGSNDTILRAWLAATQTDNVAWELSADGGANWQTVQPDGSWNQFSTPGDDLLWRSTPTWMVTGDNPSVSNFSIKWAYEFAVVEVVMDVPDDQGGWVRVYFTGSGRDHPDETSFPIEDYGIWQLLDNPSLVAAVNAVPSPTTDKSLAGEKPVLAGVPVVTYEGKTYVQSRPGLAAASFPPGTWELVLSVPAVQQDDYIARVSTTVDSSSAGPNYSVYMITAHTSTPSIWYASPPDSGYSVDNIAPAIPANFSAAYNTGSGNHLVWDPCPDDDFQYFCVYRSTDPGFVPSPATLVFSTVSTDWNDPEYDGWNVHYKVTALDYVGNESDPASAGTTTGITEGTVPKRFTLGQNVPNPFNPSTTISFGLPLAGYVNLSIFGVGGKLIRTLVDSQVPAGFKSVTWDGVDHNGRRAASGVYFYRLEGAGETITKKMILLK